MPNKPTEIAIGWSASLDRLITREFHLFYRECGTAFSMEASADACKKHPFCKNGVWRIGADCGFSAPKIENMTIGAERISLFK